MQSSVSSPSTWTQPPTRPTVFDAVEPIVGVLEKAIDAAATLLERHRKCLDRPSFPEFSCLCRRHGIGLPVSRSIIEGHGGRLWAECNDGPGATFSFSIPR